MSTTCYLPSGDKSDSMRACGDDSDGTRHCCYGGHYCLSNHLCLVPDDLSIYRGGCTAEKWADDKCGTFCKQYSGSHSGVHRCDNETDRNDEQLWACLPSDCGTDSDMFIIGDAQIMRNAQLSSAVDMKADSTKTVEVTAATITGSCAATSDASPGADSAALSGASTDGDSCDSTGVSSGTAVGIGLGISIPLLIIIAAVTWMFWRERRKSKHLIANEYKPGMSATPPVYKAVGFPRELASETHRSMSELPHDSSDHSRAELDASSPTSARR